MTYEEIIAKSTPRPWVTSAKLSGSENDRGWDIYSDKADHWLGGLSPIIKNERGDASDEAKANAAYIVLAVNAHEALVEALGEVECAKCGHDLRLHLGKDGCEHEFDAGPCQCNADVPIDQRAIAALALAKGGKP